MESSFDQDVAFAGLGNSLICPAGNGAVECYGGGATTDPKPGTPLAASFFFTVNGSVTGELPQYSDPTDLAITLNGNDVILNTKSTSTLASLRFTFLADQSFELNVTFALEIGCTADVCSAAYGNPDLTDVLITDGLRWAVHATSRAPRILACRQECLFGIIVITPAVI